MKNEIRILLIDDHQIVREGLRLLVERTPGMTIVGEAECGRTAIEQTRKLTPDVLVMDVYLPDMNGIEVSRQLLTEFTELKVIILSGEATKDLIDTALQAGVCGYIVKSSAAEELIRAIHAVLEGRLYLCPISSTEILRDYKKTLGVKSTSTPTLSARELEVLKLIAAGLRIKEIASRLGLGVKTAETYRRRLGRKLDINSVAGLTRYALEHGLVDLVDRPGKPSPDRPLSTG